MAARPYHVVVWGANGFTGRLVCEHIAKNYQGKINWAMAGRNQGKLEAVRADLGKLDGNATSVPIVLADLEDQASLDSMTASTNTLINMVGPYTLYGGPVVQACINSSTNYCDLTGETNFVQDNISAFHLRAQGNECKIVHACGFDSVPSDVGTLLVVDHLKQKYGLDADEVEFMLKGSRGGFSGGTLESVVTMLRQPGDVLKRVGHPYALTPAKAARPASELPDGPMRILPEFSALSGTWSGPFIMAPYNEQVVRRTADLLGYGESFKYKERIAAKSQFVAALISLGTALAAAVVFIAAKINLVRKLLTPAGSGPSRKTMEEGFFTVELVGKSVPDASGEAKQAFAVVKDPHRDPGYYSTSRMILEIALCMALQAQECAMDAYASKHPGGVLTPAAAGGFVLVNRLKAAGFVLRAADTYEGIKTGKKSE